MITYRVRVLDMNGQPLRAGVELHTSDGGVSALAMTNSAGIVEVELDDELAVTLALAMPFSGHWVTHAPGGLQNRTVRCVAHHPVARPPWWHQMLGKHRSDSGAGHGIRIGIVDFGFVPEGRLAHVRALYAGSGATQTHGERVARFLAEQPTGQVWGGVAPGADVVLAAVDSRGPATTRCVAEAMEALTDVPEPPHLINLSLGFFREDLDARLFSRHEDLEMAVESCREAGCLPVAAVGNNPERQTAFPAALPGVVGVSSIGLAGAVPTHSWAGVLEKAALGERLVGVLPSGERVYPSVLASVGDVDVVAPGIGVLLEQEDGVIYDYIGTSYAAPLATGILAMKLASDNSYLSKTGLERTEHAEAVLRSMCLEVAQAGADFAGGVPRL